MKALQDIVVLDLTRVLAGPYCTMMLADFGADVIKIEIPVKGDDTRGMGPFVNNSSLYYANVNRNKKSVTLNLKDPKGKELFLAMVKKADVVVENYRPGVMDKLGVGYDVLKEVNDRIIYAAVSGFGSYGRNSARPGYDIIAQAYGGLMSITGEPDGEPLRVGTAIGDVLGGMNLTIGVLMALHARELSGKGQRVDVALVDSVISSLETGTQRYFASGKLPRRIGNRYASAYPYDSFKAKDGSFVIGCGNDKLFNLLCTRVLHREDLLTDPRFLNNALRCENHAALKVEIEKWSTTVTAAPVSYASTSSRSRRRRFTSASGWAKMTRSKFAASTWGTARSVGSLRTKARSRGQMDSIMPLSWPSGAFTSTKSPMTARTFSPLTRAVACSQRTRRPSSHRTSGYPRSSFTTCALCKLSSL